jgi:hypothetical protein
MAQLAKVAAAVRDYQAGDLAAAARVHNLMVSMLQLQLHARLAHHLLPQA